MGFIATEQGSLIARMREERQLRAFMLQKC